MPLRIAILAFGTLGDVLPYIALGRGFIAAGDHVRIATHARFAGLAGAHGLEVAAIADDPEMLLRSPEGRAWLASGANPLRFGLALRRVLRPRVALYLRAAWEASEGADAIIASGLAVFVAASVAEQRRVPCVPAFLQPVTPGGGVANAFASAGGAWPLAGRLGHALHWHGAWALLRGSVNRARREVLDLPPIGPGSPFGLDHGRALWLYGFSAAALPVAPAWGSGTQVTGYWFLDAAEPPAEPLRRFLDEHPGAVCIGFGSMSDPRPAETEALLTEAVRRASVPAVLLSGWSGSSGAAQERGLIRLPAAPHRWLFERVGAVVHHGGAGTVAATLRTITQTADAIQATTSTISTGLLTSYSSVSYRVQVTARSGMRKFSLARTRGTIPGAVITVHGLPEAAR